MSLDVGLTYQEHVTGLHELSALIGHSYHPQKIPLGFRVLGQVSNERICQL